MTSATHLLKPEVERRVDELVGRMTLDEKIGQMNQVFPFMTPKAEATLNRISNPIAHLP